MPRGVVRRQVVLSRRALEGALRLLSARPEALAWGPAGVNRTPSLLELICCDLRPAAAFPGDHSRPAVVLAFEDAHRGGSPMVARVLRGAGIPAPLALVTVARAPRRGHLTAEILGGGRPPEPIDEVKIVGAGMHRGSLSAQGGALWGPALPDDDAVRWSRLGGALGEAALRRFRSLHFAVIGVGRTGSLVATSLSRSGVRAITLIDPDRVELHNLDASDGVVRAHLGRFKVSALYESASAITEGLTAVEAIPDSITTLRALLAVKEADALVAAVDHDGARLAAGIIGTLYAKPLLEIATGVLGHGAQRQMGADVRLVLPGDGCLLCLGGVANPARAPEMFLGRQQAAHSRTAWHEERAGSRRSLNQAAVGHGLVLFEDLVAERITTSIWLRLDIDPRGMATLRTVRPPARPDCPLCRLTGAGDEELAAVREVVASLPEA